MSIHSHQRSSHAISKEYSPSEADFISNALPAESDAPSKSRRKIKKLTASARREIELKNHARKLAGLSLIVIKIRKCIVCQSLFESSGKRTCGCQSRRSGYIAGREII